MEPPGQTFAVDGLATRAEHHITLGTYGHQLADVTDQAIRIDAIYGEVAEAAVAVPQGILNRSRCSQTDHVIAQSRQCTGSRWLANTNIINKLLRWSRTRGQLLSNRLRVL